MDNDSCQSSKYRQMKDKKNLAKANRAAEQRLLRHGTRLFKSMSKLETKQVKSFKDLFGEKYGDVVLNLDTRT
jgi:hypothetical protein